MPSARKGECAVDRRTDWLHGAVHEQNRKYTLVELNPYNPFVADASEGDVIEEYFKIEEDKAAIILRKGSDEKKEEEKEVRRTEPGSIIDIDDCSIFQRPAKKSKAKQRKSPLSDEWLLVD